MVEVTALLADARRKVLRSFAWSFLGLTVVTAAVFVSTFVSTSGAGAVAVQAATTVNTVVFGGAFAGFVFLTSVHYRSEVARFLTKSLNNAQSVHVFAPDEVVLALRSPGKFFKTSSSVFEDNKFRESDFAYRLCADGNTFEVNRIGSPAVRQLSPA